MPPKPPRQANGSEKGQKDQKDPNNQGTKRKGPPTTPHHAAKRQQQQPQHGRPPPTKRRMNMLDARQIATQTSSKAFSNGALDVDKFVKAREYEIRGLEDGLIRSKKALSKRAFQDVPQELRRRTGAHDVHRLPNKLRRRAGKEMAEDNTPTGKARKKKPTRHMRLRLETVKRLRALGAKQKRTKDAERIGEVTVSKPDDPEVKPQEKESKQRDGHAIKPRTPRIKKNMLREPPTPKAKFRKRQLHKSWLPTHLYHAKRAHMTSPREPLWRFAIPLTPTAKAYRPTHRASSERGALAWDASYMATISLHGVEQSVDGLLRSLAPTAMLDVNRRATARLREGSRVWQGWLFEREGEPKRRIAPATIIWQAQSREADPKPEEAQAEGKGKQKAIKRTVWVRVHPSAFLQTWEEVQKSCKIQKPQVDAEDLRFEIGSIELTGPGSTEALLAALWPKEDPASAEDKSHDHGKVWNSLAGVENPSMVPANALLTFRVADPRLHHPPRTIRLPTASEQTELLQVLATWPCDKEPVPSPLFERSVRLASCRALRSQSSINRRKAQAPPGSYAEPLDGDPRIPVLLYASRSLTGGGLEAASKSSGQGAWTVLLPWKAVSPVWQSIMHYPLSTGGQVRLGGLEQQRQIAFEAGVPWFPGDYPGTDAGWQWNEKESQRRKLEWQRRPKGKRNEYSSLDLGRAEKGEIGEGWACDWCRLVRGREEESEEVTDGKHPKKGPIIHHVSSSQNERALVAGADHPPSVPGGSQPIVTIRLTILGRGVANPCARIYRLPEQKSVSEPGPESEPEPSTKPSLRAQWLNLIAQQTASKSKKDSNHTGLVQSRKHYKAPQLPGQVQQRLAAELLLPPSAPSLVREQNSSNGLDSHPDCPGERGLVGFVTTGEFSLSEGRGTAIGSVLLDRMSAAAQDITLEERTVVGRRANYCIVRNAGERTSMLARWESV